MKCEINYCPHPRKFEKYCGIHQYRIMRDGLKPVWACYMQVEEHWARFLFHYVRDDRERTPEYMKELRAVFIAQYLPSFL